MSNNITLNIQPQVASLQPQVPIQPLQQPPEPTTPPTTTLVESKSNSDISESSDEESQNDKYIIDNLSPTWSIMLAVQDNLNVKIGTQLKKKYFNAAFWNYISTPINFTITLFTALSAGQTGSGSNFLNESQLFYVLLTTFVLSIVNTFFKLKEKAQINYVAAKAWEQYAAKFEEIYFSPILKNDDVAERLQRYNSLITFMNDQNVEETVEYVNYITELFFYCFGKCSKNRDYRHLTHKHRHWMLDGTSIDYEGSCPSKYYEIDTKIFRKNPKKQNHNEQNYKFLNWFG